MMDFLYIFISLLSVLLSQIHGQHVLWGANIDASGDDYGRSIATDQSGNVYVTGNTESASLIFYNKVGTSGSLTLSSMISPGTTKGFLAKYSSSGQILWAANIDGNNEENSIGVTVDPSGNVFITGSSYSSDLIFYSKTGTSGSITVSGTSGQKAFVAKYSSNGIILWAAKVDGSDNDYPMGIASDSSGNVFIMGDSYSLDLIFYNKAGTSGSITQSGRTGSVKAFFAKYSPDGLILWATRVDGALINYGRGIATDQSGNVLVTGYTSSSELIFYNKVGTSGSLTHSGLSGSYKIFVTKYSPDGIALWAANVDGTGFDASRAIATDLNGNVFVGGESSSNNLIFFNKTGTSGSLTLPGNSGAKGFLAKYSSDGLILWTSRVDGLGDDYIRAIATDPQEDIFIAGESRSTNITFYSQAETASVLTLPGISGSRKAYFAKYSSEGLMLWASKADGSGDDYARSIATDTFGDLLITGESSSSDLMVYDKDGTTTPLSLSGLSGTAFKGFVVKYNGSTIQLSVSSPQQVNRISSTTPNADSTLMQVTSNTNSILTSNQPSFDSSSDPPLTLVVSSSTKVNVISSETPSGFTNLQSFTSVDTCSTLNYLPISPVGTTSVFVLLEVTSGTTNFVSQTISSPSTSSVMNDGILATISTDTISSVVGVLNPTVSSKQYIAVETHGSSVVDNSVNLYISPSPISTSEPTSESSVYLLETFSSYYTSKSYSPVICSPGFTLNLVSNECNLCPLGFAKNTVGNTSCSKCPLGTESNHNRQTCVSCRAGTYKSQHNAISCMNCPSNSVCTATSFNCNPGYFWDTIRSVCAQCPLGFVKNITGNGKCTQCPIGTRPDPDRQNCKSFFPKVDCPIGQEANENGTACVECPVNKFRPATYLPECIDCPIGALCSAVNRTCREGYFPNPNDYTCKACEDGYVKPLPGNWDCDACGTNMYSGDDRKICFPCPAATILDQYGNCVRCGAGKQPNYDRTQCEICPDGHFKPDNTHNMCLKAPPGSLTDTISFTCKPGFELDENGLACSACFDGYVKSSISNIDKCIPCNVGTEPNIDKSVCVECSPGKFRSVLTMASPNCILCPRNTINCSAVEFFCARGYSINEVGTDCRKNDEVVMSSVGRDAESSSEYPNSRYPVNDSADNFLTTNQTLIYSTLTPLVFILFFAGVYYRFKMHLSNGKKMKPEHTQTKPEGEKSVINDSVNPNTGSTPNQNQQEILNQNAREPPHLSEQPMLSESLLFECKDPEEQFLIKRNSITENSVFAEKKLFENDKEIPKNYNNIDKDIIKRNRELAKQYSRSSKSMKRG